MVQRSCSCTAGPATGATTATSSRYWQTTPTSSSPTCAVRRVRPPRPPARAGVYGGRAGGERARPDRGARSSSGPCWSATTSATASRGRSRSRARRSAGDGVVAAAARHRRAHPAQRGVLVPAVPQAGAGRAADRRRRRRGAHVPRATSGTTGALPAGSYRQAASTRWSTSTPAPARSPPASPGTAPARPASQARSPSVRTASRRPRRCCGPSTTRCSRRNGPTG